MKKAILFTFLAFGISFCGMAQNTETDTTKTKSQEKVEELTVKKEGVRTVEKTKLKETVKAIDEKLDNGEITAEQAQTLKEKAAKKHALNIQNKLDLLDLNISLIKRNQDSTDVKNDYINVGTLLTEAGISIDSVPNLTRGGFSVNFAWSNLANTGNDYYKSAFSGGFGLYLNTILSRKDPRWRLNYGLNFEAVQLSLKNNLILKDENDRTVAAKFPETLKHSRFQLTNLIFPVHLEFGSAPITYGQEDTFVPYNQKRHAYFDTKNKFKVGIGGFFGFKFNSYMSYKYDKKGKFDQVTHHRSYNTNNFLYGVSAYVQYDAFRIFARYNLNDVFKSAEPGVNGKVISVGFALVY